jgi:uncharacterized protein (DUF885 family)
LASFNLITPAGVCAGLLLFCWASCAVDVAADVNESAASGGDLRVFISRYSSDREALGRTFDAPISPVRDDRLKKFYSDSLDALHKIDFSSLNAEGKIDYILIQNHLTHAIRQLALTEKRNQEMTPLLPFAPVILNLDQSRRSMEQVKPQQAAEALTRMLKDIEHTQKALEAGLVPASGTDPAAKTPVKPDAVTPPVQPLHADRIVARRAAMTVTRLRETLKTWFKYYDGYDPQFTWWIAQPYKDADKALEDYGKFLTEKVVGIKPDDKTTIVGDPVGREALLLELADAMIPYTPEELIALAKNEMAWCMKEMMRASRDLGYGDEWHKALEHVKDMHVEPGQQPEMIRQLAWEAIDYVEKNDLVTVPPLAKEVWRMEMMPPEAQLINPFFLGGEVIQVSFPTNTMTYEQRMMSMRGNNRPFARATVFHELIPGHHLQEFMSQRYRPYRQLFDNPFWVEGNAFYWEMLLWDMGFPKTPEERVGMLFWRMHRCARVIFSLSFHLGRMTAPQCVDYLVENVGHERDNAAAEVRRSFESYYSPIYQSAYMLGALQFRALHKELVDSGTMTNRAFHDAILEGNYMPVDLVRARLTNQTLTPDYKSTWMFYGPIPNAK